MNKLPTIREDAKQEHHRAKWWRLHIAGLSVEQLAEATGYSARSIYNMELGIDAKGKRVKPWVWQRYKRMCAGVANGGFDWNESK